MFDAIDKANEWLTDFQLDELYKDRGGEMETKQVLIDALVMTLEYYSLHGIYNDIRAGQNSIYIDAGQRARNMLDVYEEYKHATDLDEADLHDIKQAHKGFIADIKLPKGFKFIEVREKQDDPIRGE